MEKMNHLFFMLSTIFCLATACASGSADDIATASDQETTSQGDAMNITIKITSDSGEHTLNATLAENKSALAFAELLKKGPVTVNMSDYGSFEKVGSLGTSLPRTDTQITTEAGDIILYQGKQITIYYDTNSWNFTRLGKVTGVNQAELKAMLGKGDVTAVFALAESSRAVKLNSGYNMPVLGLGTWTLTGSTCENAVYAAIKNGYRLIDTAKYYGNEKEVGNALHRAVAEGICKREEIFITTKLLPWSGNPDSDIEDSLQKLGVSYIDLCLLHQHGSDSEDDAVYKAMIRAVKAGKIRSIGISNFYTEKTVAHFVKDFDLAPAVIQNENHLVYQNNALRAWCAQKNIFIESYYPFGGRGHTKEHLQNQTVLEIARAHNKTAAQIILRWHLQAGCIAIPGSSNPDHIAENFAVWDFSLTDSEMKKLAALDTGRRYENW